MAIEVPLTAITAGNITEEVGTALVTEVKDGKIFLSMTAEIENKKLVGLMAGKRLKCFSIVPIPTVEKSTDPTLF